MNNFFRIVSEILNWALIGLSIFMNFIGMTIEAIHTLLLVIALRMM